MKIYIAGPLFNDAEKAFNEKIDAVLRECGHETYLPQRDGGIVAEMPDTVEGQPKQTYVFRKDLKNLETADVFLLLMDGRVPDEGACVALGYCYARGKRCVGYQTDVRLAFGGENNIMLSGALETVLHTPDELRAFFGRNEK